MEVIENLAVLESLVAYWKKQHIPVKPNAEEALERAAAKKIALPYDFKEFYSEVNGMDAFYPCKSDGKGFLFYPLQAIVPARKIAEIAVSKKNGNILIFAEYMQKTWWYGIQQHEDGDYTIGLVSRKGTFKPITNFLEEFIDLYLVDSSRLYDCFELYSSYHEHMIR
jgi:hypothetical protein